MEPIDQTENQSTLKIQRCSNLYYPPKLIEQEKQQVCRWLAEFKKPPQIQQLLKEQFGKRLALQSIYGYAAAPKWKLSIDRYRAQWVAGVMQEPLAHKRTRLRAISQLIEEAESDEQRSGYQKRCEIAKYLDQARREIDEGKTDATNFILTNVNQFNEAERMQRLNQLVEQLKQWRPPNKTIDTQSVQGEIT